MSQAEDIHPLENALRNQAELMLPPVPAAGPAKPITRLAKTPDLPMPTPQVRPSFLPDPNPPAPTLRILPEFHTVTGPPAFELQNEQPWHRLLAYMLLRGATQKRCAEELGKTPTHITQVKKQPWFRKLMAELADNDFDVDIRSLLQSEAVAAIAVLSDLAQTAKSESVQRSAATTLLEQFLRNETPKAPKDVKSPQDELEAINNEIKAIEGRL